MSDEFEAHTDEEPLAGVGASSISRRSMLKKTAIAGGVAMWAVPAVEMVGTKLAAAGSLAVAVACTGTIDGGTEFTTFCGSTVTVSYNAGPSTTSYSQKFVISADCSSFTESGTGTAVTLKSYTSTSLLFTVASGEDITNLSVKASNGTNAVIYKNTEQQCATIAITLVTTAA